MKNLCGKTRKLDNPYEVWVDTGSGWTWRVLKKWQADDNKPYGRWFCAVKSPMTHGGYDMGDVYVNEIIAIPGVIKLEDKELIEYLKINKW